MRGVVVIYNQSFCWCTVINSLAVYHIATYSRVAVVDEKSVSFSFQEEGDIFTMIKQSLRIAHHGSYWLIPKCGE